MKRTLAGAVVLALLAGAAAVPLEAQLARQLLDRMIDALGGRDLLATIKDTTLTGTIDMTAYGLSGTVVMTSKEPDKIRVDITVGGMALTQAYDGTSAWMTNPQAGNAAQDMDAAQSAEFRRQALGNDALLRPERYGIAFAVKGKENVKDADCLILEQAYADGEKILLYVDLGSYLVVKSKGKATDQTGATVETETFMSDYRPEGGMMIAREMVVLQGGAEFMKMRFQKAVVNAGLADAVFARPKK